MLFGINVASNKIRKAHAEKKQKKMCVFFYSASKHGYTKTG